METVTRYTPALGRMLLSALFLSSGFAKITGFTATAGWIAAKGLPLPELLLVGAIIVEILGGLAVLLGFRARLGALALAGFTIAAGVLFHNYWSVTDPAQAYVEQIMFWKNLAIAGGLLLVARHGAGALSLDNWLSRRQAAEPTGRALTA